MNGNFYLFELVHYWGCLVTASHYFEVTLGFQKAATHYRASLGIPACPLFTWSSNILPTCFITIKLSCPRYENTLNGTQNIF